MKKPSIFRNSKFVEGFCLSLISLFFIRESLKLHTGKSWALSPALFPLIITMSIFILSIALIIKSFREERAISSKIKKQNLIRLVLIILISFLYLIVLKRVHFLISSIVYIFLFLIILGERKWWLLAAISIIIPLLIQYIFGDLLDVFLP